MMCAVGRAYIHTYILVDRNLVTPLLIHMAIAEKYMFYASCNNYQQQSVLNSADNTLPRAHATCTYQLLFHNDGDL